MSVSALLERQFRRRGDRSNTERPGAEVVRDIIMRKARRAGFSVRLVPYSAQRDALIAANVKDSREVR